VDALTEWRAQRWLATLASRFGAEGLRVAAAVPRLGAAVDQHAAAVRDVLLPERDTDGACAPLDRVLLAGYARGLLDRSGLSIQEVRARTPVWIDPDWLTLRLLAVCAMNQGLPPVRRTVIRSIRPTRSR
jgi:hypothetical protein